VSAINTGSSIADVILDNIVANNSVGAAGVIIETSNTTINTLTATNLTTNNNAQRGFYMLMQGSGGITGSVSHLTATSNGTGFFSWARNSSSASFKLENVTTTGNTTNGVYIFDDTTGSITADLGGGTLGSTGNNSIHSNTGVDIRVDLDGAELKAENNWWGVNTGLTGGEVTLNAGSSIDATPFLTAAP
jgi:hypothetical protein